MSFLDRIRQRSRHPVLSETKRKERDRKLAKIIDMEQKDPLSEFGDENDSTS